MKLDPLNSATDSSRAPVDRAVTRYLRESLARGEIAQQPSRASSTLEDGHVVLRNVRGELARYRVTTKGRLLRGEPSGESAP